MININYNTFGEQIEQIGQEVLEKKALPEYKDVHEKEIVKEVISPLIKQSVVENQQEKVIENQDEREKYLPEYMATEPAEVKEKVEELIQVAFDENIVKAASRASKRGDYFVDAFHDALSGKIYDELKQKKVI